MSEIIKIMDERETQKKQHKTKKTKTEKNKGGKGYSERIRAKWFYYALGALS